MMPEIIITNENHMGDNVGKPGYSNRLVILGCAGPLIGELRHVMWQGKMPHAGKFPYCGLKKQQNLHYSGVTYSVEDHRPYEVRH